MTVKSIISSIGAISMIGGGVYAVTHDPIGGGVILGGGLFLTLISAMWKNSERVAEFVGGLTGQVTPDNIKDFVGVKPKHWDKNGRLTE